MKKTRWMGFLIVACMGVWMTSGAQGQQGVPNTNTGGLSSRSAMPSSGSVGPVAVINLGKLVREHPKFNAQLSQLRNDIQQVEQYLQQQNQEIAKMVDGLKEYNIGSAEYSQLDDQIAKRRVDLDSYVKTQERAVSKERARIQYQAFKEIKQELENYCMQNGISTVMHSVTPTEVNPENPREVGLTMNQTVVWRNPRVDITEKILQRIQQKHATRPAPTTGSPSAQY